MKMQEKRLKQLNDPAGYNEVKPLPQKWSLIKQIWRLKFVTDEGQTGDPDMRKSMPCALIINCKIR